MKNAALSAFFTKILAAFIAAIVPVVTLLSLPFTGLTDSEPAKVREQAGGFMKGICHTDHDFDMIKGANIEWIREDIPVPFDRNGEPSIFYEWWKQEAAKYVENGFKIFAVTPYPKDFIYYGFDPREEEGAQKIKEIAEFYVNDLRGIVSAYQIANEMGVDRFTAPLTMEEAARFIGIQLEAMAPLTKGNELIGYNLGGLGFVQLIFKMTEYNKLCDYVGCDLYVGSFENLAKNIDTYFAALNLVRAITRRPIIMTEFGYIGYGEPKTREEKDEILRSYGFESEEDAAKDIDTFVSRLPGPIRDEFDRLYKDKTDEEKLKLLFDGEYTNHIYKSLQDGTGLYGYEHTPEGQAKFYSYLIPKLRKLPWCIGAIIYMWDDSDSCYVCGQEDCPVETGWGIVDGNGEPKPAYYAVQKAFE